MSPGLLQSRESATSYIYDADGNQLIRRDSDKTTLFMPLRELVRNHESGVVTDTRYYSHNGINAISMILSLVIHRPGVRTIRRAVVVRRKKSIWGIRSRRGRTRLRRFGRSCSVCEFPHDHHDDQWKMGYYDPGSGIFVAKTVDGNVNTVMANVSQAYVNRLQGGC